MTDDRNIDENEHSQTGPARVVRDPSFTKLFADGVFLQDLGRDVDLCLIQFGQPLTHFVSNDSEFTLESSNCVTEAGRVRVSWPTAVTIAMNILSRGIENDLVRGDKIIESLQEMIDVQKNEEVNNTERPS